MRINKWRFGANTTRKTIAEGEINSTGVSGSPSDKGGRRITATIRIEGEPVQMRGGRVEVTRLHHTVEFTETELRRLLAHLDRNDKLDTQAP